MKRSTAVVLVLSGAAMLTGCSQRDEPPKPAARESQTLTNDTYVAGRGYYHSPFHMFFPFPYNHYSPGMGYYRGGRFHAQPDLTVPKPTYPGRSQAAASRPSQNVNRGGFTRSPSRSSGWGYRSSGA